MILQFDTTRPPAARPVTDPPAAVEDVVGALMALYRGRPSAYGVIERLIWKLYDAMVERDADGGA